MVGSEGAVYAPSKLSLNVAELENLFTQVLARAFCVKFSHLCSIVRVPCHVSRRRRGATLPTLSSTSRTAARLYPSGRASSQCTPGSIPHVVYVHLAGLEMRLSVFRELLSLRCIKIRNLCAYHQEDVLRIPKHPQLAKFA